MPKEQDRHSLRPGCLHQSQVSGTAVSEIGSPRAWHIPAEIPRATLSLPKTTR